MTKRTPMARVGAWLGAVVAGLALTGAPSVQAGSPAARLINVVAPASKAPTLASLPPPVFAADLNVRTVQGYKGPLFRVANAGAVERDCSSAACADAFVATTIVGVYDQVTTALVSFSTPLTYQKTSTNLVGGFVQTNASGARTMTLPSGLLATFNGVSGATASLVMGMHTSAPASTLNLLNISTGTSSSASRYGITAGSTFALRVNARRLDADTTAFMDFGDFRGGVELIGATWDQNTGSGRAYRYGAVGYSKADFLTTGSASATDALAAQASIPIGATFYGLALWDRPISATQEKGLLAWQRWTYGHLRTIFADGAASWWNSPNPVDNGNGQLLLGMANAAAAQLKTEIDIASRLPTDWFVASPGGIWSQDDHHANPSVILGNGQLVEVYTGHGNSLSGSLDGRIGARVSKTGRIADLGDETVLTTNLLAANYMEGHPIGLTDAVWFTNDDSDASWLPIRYTGETFSQGLRLVRQLTAPGGGQNQLYDFTVKVSSDTIRHFFIPHASNAQNSIYLAHFNATTGVLTSGANGSTSFGSAYPGPGTVGTALAAVTSLSTIYTPPSGKSARLLNVNSDGTRVLIEKFDAGGYANAAYHELIFGGGDPFDSANWTEGPQIALAGLPFYNAGGDGHYPGGAVYANEAHSGVRIYLSREASGTWYIDRMDSADNGATWTTTNVASSATTKLIRPMSPRNATTPTLVYWGFADFTSWSDWRGRPIITLVPISSNDNLLSPAARRLMRLEQGGDPLALAA